MTRDASRVLDAVLASVDREKLATMLGSETPESAPATSAPATSGEARLAERLVLADLLDDSILGARPSEPAFALRALFGELAAGLESDDGFALAVALNAFFRVESDEETRMRLGVDASRLYYRFVASRLAREVVAQTSPLLAQLLSTQLERVRLESVDHQRVFDSSVHERAPGADGGSATIQSARSFLCRVVANGLVRVKATVTT